MKNVHIRDGGNRWNIRPSVIFALIAVCIVIVLLPSIFLDDASERSHPQQYIETHGQVISGLFLQDASTRGLDKDDVLLYHGLVREDKLAHSIHDRETKLEIIKIMNCYWKANELGDFQTKSGNLIFMHAAFHDNCSSVYFKIYKGYKEYMDDHDLYTSATYSSK